MIEVYSNLEINKKINIKKPIVRLEFGFFCYTFTTFNINVKINMDKLKKTTRTFLMLLTVGLHVAAITIMEHLIPASSPLDVILELLTRIYRSASFSRL